MISKKIHNLESCKSGKSIDKGQIKTEEMQCKLCEKIIKTKKDLIRHQLRVHEKKRNFTYEFCNATFFERTELHGHILRHIGEKPFSCKICSKTFFSIYQRNFHEKRCHYKVNMKPKRTRDFECALCNKKFFTSKSLEKHIVNRHQLQKCVICEKECANKTHLRNHVRVVHEDKRKYACLFCGSCFPTRDYFWTHIHRHVQEKPFMCILCGESFLTLTQRKRHSVKIHGNENEHQRHQCKKCGSKFISEIGLALHNRRNSDCRKPLKSQRRFRCNFCEKTFRRPGHLKYHIQTHTQEKPFKCRECGKAFTRSESLTSHRKNSHQNSSLECTFCDCDKAIISKVGIVRHILQHIEEKPYHCKICGEEFAASAYRYTHLRAHARGKQTFACGICNAKFEKGSDRYFHQLQHFCVKTGTTGKDGRIEWKCGFCGEAFRELRTTLFTHLTRVHHHEMKSSGRLMWDGNSDRTERPRPKHNKNSKRTETNCK